MIKADTPTFMGCPRAISPQDLFGADIVIIGSPYVTSWTDEYAGVAKSEWLAGPKMRSGNNSFGMHQVTFKILIWMYSII